MIFSFSFFCLNNSPNQDEIVYKDSGSIIWKESLAVVYLD